MIRKLAFALAAAATLAAGALGAARAEEVWQQLPPPAALPQPVENGYAPVNGVEIYYAVYGAGTPVILLHGGLGNLEYWGNQVPALAERYKVIAMDSRGHGRSTRSGEPYSYGLMASDVLALMDYLKIDKAAIVGWSDGGIIGIDIAIHHPERLTKLFAFGANTNVAGLRDDIESNPTFGAYIELAGKDYARLSKTPKDYDGFLSAIGEMWATQPNYSAEQLAAITTPTAIADGEHDEAIRQDHNIEMARMIPDAELIILPGVSHFAMLQRPEAFNEAVLHFLAK